jgi:MYXO-CTERM domain-containing protein
MAIRPLPLQVHFACLILGALALAPAAARAEIPAGYTGKPFDPKVAGGPLCPATVKGGPYTIPGRLDFVNYDMGGDGITFHTGDHIVKGGTGYRVDNPPTATFSLTTACQPTCPNVWYDTSAALDGTVYPSPTTGDFSIGAVQNGDWMDLTVNVTTTGDYTLSSTWATGNGPPGGEGGDGTIGLKVFSNNVMLATWTATFPNFNTTADFRHWKAYPNFATVHLTAGPQVIKLQSGAKHLQMDYVQFDLVGADGGTINADAGAPADAGGGAAGASGTGGTTGTAGGAGGATAVAGSTGTSGGAGGNDSAGTAGASSGTAGQSAGAGAPGSAGTSASGSAGAPGQVSKASSGGCSCAIADDAGRGLPAGAAFAVVLVALRRRSRRR